MRKAIFKSLSLLLVFGTCALLSSCAYLNTYYNAQKYYKEGVKENKDNETGPPRTTNYQKAINSAAHVIEDYPKSRYVDDAIMIIGKAYFDMRNYPGAKRKFEELIANYPKSPLIYEAKLFSAKTLIALRQSDEGIAVLNDLYADEATTPEIRIKGQRTLADYYFTRENYRQALIENNKILQTSKDREERAEVYFQLGECNFKLGDFEQAKENYLKVAEEKPTRKRQFDAIFKFAVTLKEQKDLEGALETCEKLLKNDVYFPYFDSVNLIKAGILAKLHRTEEAEALYKRVIELYPRTKTSAEASFRLGLLYLYELSDFAKSEEYLNKVRNEQAQSEFIDTAQVKINDLRKLTSLTAQIDSINIELDTLNFRLGWIAEHPGGVVPDSIKLDSTSATPGDSLLKSFPLQPGLEPPPGQPGALSREEIDRMIAERRSESEMPENIPGLGPPGSNRPGMNPQMPGLMQSQTSRRAVLVELPTDSSKVLEWLIKDRKFLADLRFRLAEHLWLQFDKIDSAHVLLEDLAQNSEHEDVKARAILALYHMAESTSSDSTASDSLLQRIHNEFPESEYDRFVRIKLGLEPLPEKVDTASVMFQQAEKDWMTQDDAESALLEYEKVRKLYPKTDLGAKSAYAQAYLQEYVLKDVNAAKAAYDSLIVWYPNSPYVAIAEKKLAPPPPEVPDSTEMLPDSLVADSTIALTPAPSGSGSPSLIGGDEALLNYIHLNSLYPPIALEASITGDVTVSFIIDAAGKPRDFNIENEDPTGFDFGENAIQALKNMRYKPGYNQGKYEDQPFTQRVRFVP